MYQEERLLKILEYLNENNNMSIHNICEMFSVSRDTARRDILKLIEQGAVTRTHGGICLPTLKNTIKAYRERIESYSEDKSRIAKRALEFINEDEKYFFDVSTIIRLLCENLDKKVKILTHSLDNIEILSENNDVDISSIGGHLNKDNRFFYKLDCIDYINGIRFDTAFLGAASISEDGFYYVDEEDAFIKHAAVKKSAKVIMLAEYEKFKRSSYYKGAGWDEIDVIITNKMPPSTFVQIIEAYDIQLIIV